MQSESVGSMEDDAEREAIGKATADFATLHGVLTLEEYAKDDYALVDNATRRVCWAGPAASPIEACELADRARGLLEFGRFRYKQRQALAPDEAGYLVFDAFAGVLDDAAACAALAARPARLAAGCFARVR